MSASQASDAKRSASRNTNQECHRPPIEWVNRIKCAVRGPRSHEQGVPVPRMASSSIAMTASRAHAGTPRSSLLMTRLIKLVPMREAWVPCRTRNIKGLLSPLAFCSVQCHVRRGLAYTCSRPSYSSWPGPSRYNGRHRTSPLTRASPHGVSYPSSSRTLRAFRSTAVNRSEMAEEPTGLIAKSGIELLTFGG